MFIKIIKWQKEIGPNIEHPTELYHASNYEMRDDGNTVTFDITLINGNNVTCSLPKEEFLKTPTQTDTKECAFYNVSNISVYVTNDTGKTIQSYNL